MDILSKKKYVRRNRVTSELTDVHKDIKAASQTVSEMDGQSDAQSTVAVVAAASTAAKVYSRVQHMKLKTGVMSGVRLGKGYIKVVKKIRDAKRHLVLMEASSSAEIKSPLRVSKGPKVRLSEETKQNLSNRIQRRGELGTEVKPVLYREAVKVSAPVLRNAKEYDISGLEEKNGIKPGKKVYVSAKNSVENLEQKNKVRSKEAERKDQLTPKEREELHGKAKADRIADKNKVRSKERTDNLRKKRKKMNHPKSVASTAMKREMKLFVAKQVVMEGENSGAGELIVNVGKSVLLDKFWSAAKISMKLAGKMIVKILIGVGTVLLNVVLGILSMLAPILLSLVVIIIGVISIIILAAAVIGWFVSTFLVGQDDFVVKVINSHKEALLAEAESYIGKQYEGELIEGIHISYQGVSGIDSNSDDILLVYMTRATDSETFVDQVNESPLLNVDSSAERSVMEETLNEMLYIKSVSYSKETRIITITPTPTPTPQPDVTIVPSSAPTPTLMPEALPGSAPNMNSSPEPSVTPIPGNVPTPTILPENNGVFVPDLKKEPQAIKIETYYVANIVISGMSAKEWAANNIDGTEKTVYAFFLEMFESFGYQPKGGDTVCNKYLEVDLE